MWKWLNTKTDLQINKFNLFILSEIFLEKYKLLSLF